MYIRFFFSVGNSSTKDLASSDRPDALRKGPKLSLDEEKQKLQQYEGNKVKNTK